MFKVEDFAEKGRELFNAVHADDDAELYRSERYMIAAENADASAEPESDAWFGYLFLSYEG